MWGKNSHIHSRASCKHTISGKWHQHKSTQRFMVGCSWKGPPVRFKKDFAPSSILLNFCMYQKKIAYWWQPLKKPQKQNKPVKLRVQYQLFRLVQQPETQCCVGTREFQAVCLIDKVHHLLPNEHESMRRKAKICWNTWHHDGIQKCILFIFWLV